MENTQGDDVVASIIMMVDLRRKIIDGRSALNPYFTNVFYRNLTSRLTASLSRLLTWYMYGIEEYVLSKVQNGTCVLGSR